MSVSRITADLFTSLPPWLVGLIVFGGLDPLSNVVMSKSAFDVWLSKDKNCEVWKKLVLLLLPEHVYKITTKSTKKWVILIIQQTRPYSSFNQQTIFQPIPLRSPALTLMCSRLQLRRLKTNCDYEASTRKN